MARLSTLLPGTQTQVNHFKAVHIKLVLLHTQDPLISVAWMNSRPGLPWCSYFKSILLSSARISISASLEMCLHPG